MHTFAQEPKATQKTTSATTTLPARTRFGQSHEVKSILHLQRTIGNQTVQRLLQSNTEDSEASSVSSTPTGFGHDFTRIPVHVSGHSHIQPKLKVGTPRDKYEQEADHVADQVMRMPEPKLQRARAYGEGNPKWKDKKHELTKIRRVLGYNAGETVAPPNVHDVLRSPGQPMDPATRAFFEPRFAYDFSNVRLHTDKTARESAKAINALAYTSSNHIVIGSDQHSFTSEPGKKLLAHELAHVLQQGTKSDNIIQRLSNPACGTTTPLPLSGSCRTGFIHTCYSETVVPSSSSALNITVTVDYTTPPGPIVAGKEDFSVQVYKCGIFWDTRIGSKRISKSLPNTLRFSIASVTPGDKYYIKIYSRSHLPLNGQYMLAQ